MVVNSGNLGEMNKGRASERGFFTAFTALFLTALLFLALCFVLRITPFGDKTFLYEDMKQQYVDFFSYYHNVWHGKDGFMFSNNCGLGSEMFGIWAYYLMSPFLLMFAVIPADHYATAVTFLIMMKMSAMAFCMSLLFSHISKRYPKEYREYSEESEYETGGWRTPAKEAVLNVILSVAFAYCGWTVANMTNIMWLDAVILMPIVVMGYDKLVRREKHGLLIYVLSTMAMVVVNYYIAAMVLIFLGMFAVLNTILPGAEVSKSRIRGFARFMAGSFLALLLDLWFLIPTVFSLMGSNKDHSDVMTEAFEKYLPSSEAMARSLNPFSVLPKLFTMSYDSMEIMDGLPNIYFGAVLIVPCILFFANKKISSRVRALFGTFLIFVMAFFCIKPLNTLAHGGTEAYGYLYRYSFVFSFVCLIMVYLCLLCENGVGVRKLILAEIITLALLGVVVTCRVRFIGGKSLFINLFLIVISSISVMSLFVSRGKARQYALPLLGIILAADLSLNFICIYRNSSMNAETVSGYKAKCAETEQALLAIKRLEEGADKITGAAIEGEIAEGVVNIENAKNESELSVASFRIESLDPRTPNDSIHYDYRGTTSYNSLLKVENRLLMYKLGFNDNGLYTMYEAGNTRCADAILGVKYLITDEEDAANKIRDNSGQEALAEDLIKNNCVLSADLVNENSVPELLELIEAIDNPFDAQEAVWRYFTGSEAEVFAKGECTPAADSNSFRVTPSEDGEVYFYMNRDNTNERSLEIWCDGEFVSGYGNASCQKVIDLGYHEKGEEISLEIKDADGLGSLPDEPVVVTEMVEALVQSLQ